MREKGRRKYIELERAIREYVGIYNENPKPFIWTKTADAILAQRRSIL